MIRNKKSFWYANFSKIAPHRGGKKATIAVVRARLVAIYHMLKNTEPFNNGGADYYFTLDAERIKNKHIASLKRLEVTCFLGYIRLIVGCILLSPSLYGRGLFA